MISATGVKRYCESIFGAKPIYLWGADVQVLTEERLDNLKLRFGEKNYTKIDIKSQEGKLGADCSGFLTPISGVDSTASGYYKSCKEKGKAANTPTDKTCLLFREESGRIVHVAVYTGDGLLYEMWDGCERRSFNAKQWSYYGIPSWIKQTPKDMVTLSDPTDVYMSSSDALAGRNPVAKYPAGEYYIYKKANGCINISKEKGKPGGWIVE